MTLENGINCLTWKFRSTKCLICFDSEWKNHCSNSTKSKYDVERFGEVSPSCLLSSGITHFHLTAHHTKVAGSSDRTWKLTFSDKPVTLHDSFENNSVKECNSVAVTVDEYQEGRLNHCTHIFNGPYFLQVRLEAPAAGQYSECVI